MQNFHREKIKILAFDVDGTLFSSENIILDTYIESIQNFISKTDKAIIIPSKEKIIEQVGLPVKQIFKNLFPELEEEERNSISDSILILLCQKIHEKKGNLYPEVQETIKELYSRNYLLCIASNGRSPYIDAILNAYELKNFFQDLIVIDYTNIHSKGDILKAYLRKFNQTGQNAIMIGDRKSDLDAALEGESPFVFCEYGHAEPGEIESYCFQLSAIKELFDYL